MGISLDSANPSRTSRRKPSEAAASAWLFSGPGVLGGSVVAEGGGAQSRIRPPPTSLRLPDNLPWLEGHQD